MSSVAYFQVDFVAQRISDLINTQFTEIVSKTQYSFISMVQRSTRFMVQRGVGCFAGIADKRLIRSNQTQKDFIRAFKELSIGIKLYEIR